MNNIRVLIWDSVPWDYLRGIVKAAGQKFKIECKDRSEFSFISRLNKNAGFSRFLKRHLFIQRINNLLLAIDTSRQYNSQSAFDKIMRKYKPDIIVLYQATSENLTIDIPSDVKVISYWDLFFEKLSFIGKTYFEQIPENNYVYIPVLNADRIDRHNVLKNDKIRERIYFAPFVSFFDKKQFIKNSIEKVDLNDHESYICDLSVISNYKNNEYYYYNFEINHNTFQGKMLIQFINELVILIKQEIKKREAICLDNEWIHKILVQMFDKLEMEKYIRDKEEFISVWFNALKFVVIPHEYEHCVVDWLIEGEYNLVIYGKGWDRIDKYKKYAFGRVNEGSAALRNVYKYSKINVGMNVAMGVHRRNFEVMENNCLCFQAEAQPGFMASDYSHFFEDGRDIVIYRNKKDLYEKLDFYLSHNEEREQIIRAGKIAASQCPHAEDLIENVIREVYAK